VRKHLRKGKTISIGLKRRVSLVPFVRSFVVKKSHQYQHTSMDISIEKAAADCSLGSLFQQIINDMKVSQQITII